MKHTVYTILAAAACFFAPAFAQSPEETAEAFYQALSEKDYEAMAGLMSTSSLTQFRSNFDGLMELDVDVSELMMQEYLGEEVTPENIILLSDAEFLTKFMQTSMAEAEEGLNIEYKAAKILGTVAEGDNLMHVLLRTETTINDFPMVELEIYTLEKQGEGWKMTLNDFTKQVAGGIKLEIEGQLK